jgi:hypothetical protein
MHQLHFLAQHIVYALLHVLQKQLELLLLLLLKDQWLQRAALQHLGVL